jgi:putative transposase
MRAMDDKAKLFISYSRADDGEPYNAATSFVARLHADLTRAGFDVWFDQVSLGPLYQGRFESLPVQNDGHLLTLLRYVQRNPVRAKLAKIASNWRWSGEWVRTHGEKETRSILSAWPVDRPRRWTSWVDEPENVEEAKAIRTCVRRSSPLGTSDWTQETAERLNLEWTLRPRGRPPKEANGAK